MENRPKRIGFWNRMSCESSVMRESHINHRMRAEEFCKFHNWEIVREYTLLEVPGSKVREHQAYREYRNDVRTGQIDVLLVTTLKRFARKVRILVEEMDFLHQHNIDFVSMNESIDTTSSYGKFIFHIFSGLAELESNEVSDRIKASVKPRAQRGLPLGGPAPFGYRWVNRKIEIYEPEAEIVRKAFQYFNEIGNLKPTCRRLNAEGYTSRNSKFDSSNTTIRRFLTNTAYIGKHVRNVRGANYGKIYYKPESDRIINDCPRIIDDETWNKAQKRLQHISFSQPAKEIRNSYLMSGLLHHNCGGKLYGVTHRSVQWAHYQCKKCGHKIRLLDLEKAICNVLFNVILRTDYMEDLLKEKGANVETYRKKARTFQSLYEKLKDVKDRNLLLKTLIGRIDIDGKTIRMKFRQMPSMDTPEMTNNDGIPAEIAARKTSCPQPHPCGQDDYIRALLQTVQIYPGNPAHNEGFVFEFKFEQSLVFTASFSERLATYRQLLGLKLEQVDQLAGLSIGSCSRFEKGRNTPSWASVERLARALDLDPNFLLWGEYGSLAARLAELRKRKGFSQMGLGRAAGIKPTTINEIERGHNRCPSEQTLVKISKALFVGLEQLCPGGVPWRDR